MKEKRNAGKGWLVTYIIQYKGSFLFAALLGTLAVLCAGALLFTSGYLISRSALRPENVLMVYVPIVLVRTFGFGKAIIQYLERLTGHNAVLRVLAQMRVRLYKLIEPQALSFRARFRTGDLLSLLAEDIEQLQNVYLRIVLPALSAILVYGVGIAALGRMDGIFALWMALYCGFWLFLAPAIALWLSMAKRRRFKEEKTTIYRELTDAVFGMSDWILSGRTTEFLQRFNKRQASIAKIENHLRRSEWRMQWLTRSAVGGTVVMLVIWAGKLAAENQIEVSWIAAIGLVSFPLMEALVRVADAFVRIPDYKDSMQRLKSLEKQEPPTVRENSAVSHAGNGLLETAADAIELRLENVSFRYPNTAEWSVQNVSLHAPQGYKIAVLGRSGAGKSTLLNLVLGELQPLDGRISVHTIHGRDRTQRPFSVLNQKPYLFDTTVANNIRLGRSDATDEEVRAVTEQVGLSELITKLPDGYDTRMEEAGSRFSGGERQRIALARILLQNHPVVLLDEPTVGLDPVTEAELVDTIFRVLKGKTVLWFTHHLMGVDRMDEILFLDRGFISMRGKHEQLLQSEEKYRRLYALDYV